MPAIALTIRKVGGNALSILTSDVMNRATSFVLYAMVARSLGAFEFGQLTLALTVFYTFQVFAVGGLKTLIVRQVAKDRSQTAAYFVNACAAVFFSSLASLLVLFGFVRVMRYPAGTASVILLLSLGLFPYALSAVCEGIFQAWERMAYIPCVNVPVNVLKIGSAFLLLSRKNGLYAVVFILLSSLIAIAAIELWVVLRRFPRQPAHVSLSFALPMARSATTFLGIDSVIAVMSSLNILLLSKLATETEVGLYGAANQLMVPLLLIYQSIAQSIFPAMCRRFQAGIDSLKRVAENAIELLLVLALPTVACLYFFGDWALSLLYRNPVFAQAFPVVRIASWVLVLQVFTSVLGQVLVASHREKITLRIVAIDTLANLCIGWPLISRFGLRGAAVTLLLTRVVDCCQHYIPVSRLLSGIPLANIAWKPAAAAICMAVYLSLYSGPRGIFGVTSSVAIYGALFLALAILHSGGVRAFRARLLHSWSESPSGTD